MHSSLWSHKTNTCFLNLALWHISLDDFKLVFMFEVLHRLVDHHWCSCEVSKRGWLSPCLPHMWGHSHCGIFNVGYFRMIYYQNDGSENFLKPHRRTQMFFFYHVVFTGSMLSPMDRWGETATVKDVWDKQVCGRWNAVPGLVIKHGSLSRSIVVFFFLKVMTLFHWSHS